VVRGAVERFPPGIFLRDTDLTRADAALHDFADAISGAGTLDRLHALMSAVHGRLIFDPAPTHSGTSAREAFALGRGVCQDFAHVFVACARRLGIPARYVSGYFLRTDGVRLQDAGHAWAEAFVEDLGWVGFDCAHGVCPHEQHVRVACGLDYLGAAPVRGSRQGGGRESLAVSVDVSLAQWPQSA
jgi:transglutaminase-like putative cysteine protease